MNNLFLFYGENTFASSEKLNTWKKAFIQKYGEEGLEEIEGKKLIIKNFITDAESLPFLSEKRMLIVKDYLKKGKTDDQKILAANLEKIPESTVIIFQESESPDKRLSLYKKLKKIAKTEEFKTLTTSQLNKWILDRSQTLGLNMSFSAASYLSEHCGSDLWTIKNEIQKLESYANGRTITAQMINEITTPSLHSSIFKLTDSIAAKKAKEAIQTLTILNESGEDLIRSFYMIVRHFRILIQIKELSQQGESRSSMQKKLKQHPFVIQKSASQCQNFSQEKLTQIYANLLIIDTKTKTGQIQISSVDNRALQLEVEKLILQCCS